MKIVKGKIVIPPDVQSYMVAPTPEFNFEFYDPVDVLIRLLLFSLLAADEDNLCFFPRDGDSLDDYCDGSRMKRIHEALPGGCAALYSVLFFDEVNRDEKGFATGDGGVIVGGFFKRHVRESTHAKAHFATFTKPAIKRQER